MGTDAALENLVAVVQQMMRRDGGGDRAFRFGHVLRRILGGDVLEHDGQGREGAAQRAHHALDEDGFAVENVDFRVRHFAVHEEGHAHFLHHFEHLVAILQIRHAQVGIRRGASRIQFHGLHDAAVLRAADFIGRRVVRQVQHHQRIEVHALRHGGQDALAVGAGIGRGGDGRFQVRHDDGTAELARAVRQHAGHDGAVAQVQMPVIRTGDGDGGWGVIECGHGGCSQAVIANSAILPAAGRPRRLRRLLPDGCRTIKRPVRTGRFQSRVHTGIRTWPAPLPALPPRRAVPPASGPARRGRTRGHG
ncbi:hypothetical protein D3C72_1029140 [compost metagenome]